MSKKNILYVNTLPVLMILLLFAGGYYFLNLYREQPKNPPTQTAVEGLRQCGVDSDCVVAIQDDGKCCNCQTPINKDFIGKDKWEDFESFKNIMGRKKDVCDLVDCAPCPPPGKPACQQGYCQTEPEETPRYTNGDSRFVAKFKTDRPVYAINEVVNITKGWGVEAQILESSPEQVEVYGINELTCEGLNQVIGLLPYIQESSCIGSVQDPLPPECPKTEWIDCMPRVADDVYGDPNTSLCSPEYLSWAESNCPGFKGAAY